MDETMWRYFLSSLPCIANDIPSNHEVIMEGHDGVLVNVQDPRAFAGAMNRLLGYGRLRHAIGAAAQDTVRRRFNPNAMIEANQQLYAALANERRRA
jgi:glycosyltransferase involved in cell wall biosynthesis